MDAPALSPRLGSPRWRRALLTGVVAFAVTGYVLFVAGHISPYAGGSDSSGYLNSARLLGQGEFLVPARVLQGHTATEFGEKALEPLGFLIQPSSGRMAPTYPTGLPLHLLAASWLVGWDRAPVAVNALAAFLCGGLMWAFARQLALPPVWAGAGVLLLWLCPLFLISTTQVMSDLLALAWSLATLFCAIGARKHWQWGFACGAGLGVSVLVRPTNALLVAPIVVALGFQLRAYVPVILGCLPGAAFIAFYNWRVYGSPVTTGYGDISSSFGLKFLSHNLVHFVHWIPLLLSPLVVAALATPFYSVGRNRAFAVLAAWFVSLTGFYAFYYYSGESWWNLRFILPAFPVLILAALAVLANAWPIARARPTARMISAIVLLATACGWQLWQCRQLDVFGIAREERTYPDAIRWAQRNLPARSMICCMQVSGAFFYYTDFLPVRWDLVVPDKFGALFTAAAADGRPVYAALFPFETPEALDRIGGQWTRLSTVGQVTFWRRQP